MRVSTTQIWGNAVNNLQAAQDRQMKANDQVSTQKVATDLGGYGRSAEIIASYQATLSNTQAFIDVNKTVSDRLDAQNLALERTSDAAAQAKDAIMSALASGDGTSLAVALQGAFSSSLDGLNYVHNGQYLFGGGNDDNPPVTVSTLTDLANLTQISDAFQNGDVKKSSRIDVHTTLQTGMLGSDLGTTLMGLFQQYQQQATATPFTSQLTDTQKTFLTNLSNQFSAAYDNLVEQTSLNGTMQKRVENTTSSLTGQVTSLTGLISDRTDAAMAKAYSDLQIAQVSVQASAQVLSSLKDTSLLNLLR